MKLKSSCPFAHLVLSLLATVAYAVAGEPLWTIGRSDGSAAEFALAPGQFRAYRDDALFVVGESDAQRDWPYVQPGPLDQWAGTRPHTATILFGLGAVAANGTCALRCDLVDAQRDAPPKLVIEVNGRSFERSTQAGTGDEVLQGSTAKGQAQPITIPFPASLLHKGDNTVRITTASGRWIIYDAVALEAPAGTALTPVAKRTIIAAIRPVRALIATHDGLVQPVEVVVRHFGPPAKARVSVGETAGLDVALAPGMNRVEVRMPAAERPTELPVAVAIDGRKVAAQSVMIQPVRHLTLYIVPHSHTDIGYTQVQTAVEQRQVQNLVDGIAAARRTAPYPVGARFVWNVEVLWAADLYLHRMNEAQRAEFLAAVKQGQVALNGMYANELTGLCRPEELLRLFRYACEVQRETGVRIDTAMISDVPGYTWGTVTALAQAGIRYFSAAPNYFDRIGDSVVQWQDKPFYWQSPSGRDKVLVWVPFRGYALSHIYHDLSAQLLNDLQADLDRVNYPYAIAYTRWAGHGDNAAPDPEICEFIRDWNQTYAWPRLIISSAADAFHALEDRYGDRLPVYRGDWTPYWEDGAASSAHETALNRNAADRLSQAEALYALRAPRGYPAAQFDAAWRKVLLYSEHTWGAAGSVWDPESSKTAEQWVIKRGFAENADADSKELLRLASGETAAESAPARPQVIDVWNTSSWPRTELVTVSSALSRSRDRVLDNRGRAVPAQRLSTGELAFVAESVPAFGAGRYTLETGTAPEASPSVRIGGATLDNGRVRVRIDPATGAIVELRAHDLAANLAGPGGLNGYAFLRGDALANLQSNGPVKITIGEPGPLVASLRIESAAPGCRSLTREVRLVAGSDGVELCNTIDKERAEIARAGDHNFAQKGGKESVNFGFPFAVPGGDLRVDLPIGSMQPSRDQIPGACKNWFTVGRWVDVANADYGATWVTLDAPLIEVGGLTARLLGSQRDPSVWRQTVEPTQTFYSWVMNNHWGTNYRAYQEGPTVFRYVLRPHRRADYAAATRFAVGFTQPLIAVPAAAATPAPVPQFRLSTEEVVVSSLKPSDDGKAWIIRLYGASGKDSRVHLVWSAPSTRTVWLSDTSEQPRERIAGDIAVPGWGIVTVRAENPPAP